MRDVTDYAHVQIYALIMLTVHAADWRKLFTSQINHKHVRIDFSGHERAQLKALHQYDVTHSYQ